MIEVKKTGNYKTKSGRMVEIYGFANDSGPTLAEGFFKDDRSIGQWNPETGIYVWHDDPEKDIVKVIFQAGKTQDE